MPPMASSIEHDTNTRAGTPLTPESHIIPLNNHLNMTDAKVSLMVLSASCDRKHIIKMYVPKINMPQNVTYKSHMPKCSCADMR